MTKNPLPHLAKRLAILTTAMLLLNCGLAAERKTGNLILITLDGVRYQELFGGLDLEILKATIEGRQTGGHQNLQALLGRHAEGTVAKNSCRFSGANGMQRHGSVAGNPQKGAWFA